MIYRPATSEDGKSLRRIGRMSALLLFVITLTFICGILVINSYFVTHMRVEQENSLDAAALAAAESLAQEEFLYAHPDIYSLNNCNLPKPKKDATGPVPDPSKPLFCQATQAAVDYAQKNFVGGRPLDLRAEDVVFSNTDVKERKSLYTLAAPNPTEKPPLAPLTLAQKRCLNAVQVFGRNTNDRGSGLMIPFFSRLSWQIMSRSQAVLDGYVYGFHTDPAGDTNIPIAPIGINERSWHDQVEKSVDRTCVKPDDARLPFGDFKVLLGATSHDPDRHNSGLVAPLLHLGTETVAQAVSQFGETPGVTPVQYASLVKANENRPFALDPKSLQLALPALPHSFSGNDNLRGLEDNLKRLKDKQTRLIWPLISGYNDQNAPKKAIITGFVAARIINIRRVSYHLLTDENGETVRDSKQEGDCEEGDDGKGRRRRRYEMLELTMHPTLLATSTGIVFVQDWPNGDEHLFRFPNAYVKKIRLIK